MFIRRWTVKLQYPYNKILLGIRKEQTTTTQQHGWISQIFKVKAARWKYIICGSIYKWSYNRQNESIMAESKSVVAWSGGLTADMHKVTFWDTGNVLHLIPVVVTQMYTFVSLHRTVFFTWVYFIICKSYLSKVSFMAQLLWLFPPFSLNSDNYSSS